MIQKLAFLITFVCLVGFARKVQGMVVIETQQSTSALSFSDMVRTIDLINEGRPSLKSSQVSITHAAFPASGINDGRYTTDTANNTFFQNNQGHLPGSAQYDLDLTYSPLGYDIQSIKSFYGWSGDPNSGGNQIYTVEVKRVGESNFSVLANVDYRPFNGEQGLDFESFVSISNPQTGLLASGVESIRFLFSEAGGEPGSFIREIDVMGYRTGGPPPIEKTLRMYHVGNSLTRDSKPELVAFTMENDNLGGLTVKQGFHLACGQSLTSITNNPDFVCETPPAPFGRWNEALANHDWDVVTLQAYTGPTVDEEIAATIQLIETAIAGGRNQGCNFYLYLAWPRTSDTQSLSEQVAHPNNGGNQRVTLSQDFLKLWHQAIISAFPGLTIRVIPTGVALANLDRKLGESSIGDYQDAYDLYRDVHHMNLAEGRHFAFLSMLSVLSGSAPGKQSIPAGATNGLSSTFMTLAEDVVWHAVTADQRSGVRVPSAVRIGQGPAPGVLDLSFVGTLYQSADFITWDEVVGATSPHRVQTSPPFLFFRAE